MKRRPKIFFVAILLLAVLASWIEIAHDCREHEEDTSHSSSGCVVCAFARQVAVVAVEPPPVFEMPEICAVVMPTLPVPVQSPCLFPFGPRAPPCMTLL